MGATPPALDVDAIEQAYSAALAEGRLMLQVCVCGHRWLPARASCAACLRAQWTWLAAQGGGRLRSWVIYHVAFHRDFDLRVPYNVALVELDEGPRLITNIVADNAALQAEARVRFVPAREGDRTIARFELTD
jgi:uncharacterized OB-fold protein